jgi:hypothetical protein
MCVIARVAITRDNHYEFGSDYTAGVATMSKGLATSSCLSFMDRILCCPRLLYVI